MKKLFLAFLLIVTVLTTVSCGGEKINWDDMILGEFLPALPANIGEIDDNSSEELSIEITGISEKQFADYIEACKEKGFTVDAETDSSDYRAFNAEGYELNLDYYDGEMDISLEAPMEMSNISWPNSIAGEKLPVPKSTVGDFSYEYEDNFFVYVGNTSKTEYAEYVNSCSEKGFNVDYNKGDDYYYADDPEGWSISVRYEGNNVMSIGIDPPDDDIGEDTESASVDSETENITPETTDTSAPDTTATPAPESTEAESQDEGLDPDFKAAMDSYEKFMDEYVAFMKKYTENPTDIGILSDYADYMSKYAEFVESFEKWENEEMNAEETAYYIDVQARVSKKLLEVAY